MTASARKKRKEKWNNACVQAKGHLTTRYTQILKNSLTISFHSILPRYFYNFRLNGWYFVAYKRQTFLLAHRRRGPFRSAVMSDEKHLPFVGQVFWKFNNFRNFWKLVREISVLFATVSKFFKVLVEWKTPKYSHYKGVCASRDCMLVCCLCV